MVKAVREKKQRSRVAAEVLEGLLEFEDAVRSGVPLEQRFTVRTVKLVVRPEKMSGAEIRRLRLKLLASQSIFAAVLGVSKDAVQSWEQGRRPPGDSALRMMRIFRDEPALFFRQIMLKPAA
jgi:putative transcriptional regulator